MAELAQCVVGALGEITSSRGLTCRVFNSFVGLDHLRHEWDLACLRTGASVYMTYDWVRLWWEYYGGGAELRLYAFFAGERIEALVPIYIGTLGWGPLRFRVARLVGANIPPKVFDPPIPESCAKEVMGQVVDLLFENEECDLLSFGPISELQPVVNYIETVCSQRTSLLTFQNPIRGIHSIFHVPESMEQYFSTLSKNERKNRRKYDLRLLGKEYETHVDVVSDPTETSEEFERFAAQHREQWGAEGKTGHFGAWPRALDYNRALVRAQAALGRLRFIRIAANGEVIANQYTFTFGDRYFWELPARAIDHKWERFSLGPTGIVTMIAQAMKDGINRVEGGLAHYDYKVRLGAKEYKAITLRIVNAKPAARVRFLLFSVFRQCWSYAYHKLWYRLLMPRMSRRFWRPQSRRWLRMDF